MNKHLFILLIFLGGNNAWAQDAALKDPTAPFTSTHSVNSASPRVAAKKPGPQWVLDGVLISDEGKKALLNGRWYAERNQVNGWHLERVEPAAVVLTRAGKSQRIMMYPRLTKNTEPLQPE